MNCNLPVISPCLVGMVLPIYPSLEVLLNFSQHLLVNDYPPRRATTIYRIYTVKMGCYSAPPPLACTGGGCCITPRGVIEYYLGATGMRTSAILTSYTLQICSYTPQISPLIFGTLRFSTATRPIQVSRHHIFACNC